MKRKLIWLLLVSLMLTTLTGCWNRRELNDLGFVVGIGVDKSDNGQYKFTVQMVDPSEVASQKGGGGGRTPVTTYSTYGRTLYEAAARLATFAPRAPYWAHDQIYIYGEAVAREGIGKLLDVHERDHEVRSNFYFMVAQGNTAAELLQVITPLEKVPSNKLFDSLETATKSWGSTVEIRRDDLIAAITSDGREAVLSGLRITGDPKLSKRKENIEAIQELARLQYRDVAVFRDDKLVGWLNEGESKGYNFTQNNIKKTFISTPCEGGKLLLELIRSNAKMKGSVSNGTPQIRIQLFAEANIAEVECKFDFLSTQAIAQLEKKANDAIRSQIMSAVEKCQTEFQSDIFGFGEVIHRADPKAWRTLKKDWNKHFSKTKVVVDIDTKIRRVGTTSLPPQIIEKE